MIYIRNNNKGIIDLISTEPNSGYICMVESLPDDFKYYLPFGKYTATEEGLIVSDGWVDFTNEEKEELATCVANGEEWVRGKIPSPISKLQAISHLIALGKYKDLIAALDLDTTGVKRILFESAHQLDRESTMVNEMAVALGMSSNDIDTFFADASKILI